jgi:hypothetical protein
VKKVSKEDCFLVKKIKRKLEKLFIVIIKNITVGKKLMIYHIIEIIYRKFKKRNDFISSEKARDIIETINAFLERDIYFHENEIDE